MNSAMRTSLNAKGLSKTLNDDLRSFYRSVAANGGTVQDCEKSFLAARGYTSGTLQDRCRKYASTKGFTGSLNDFVVKMWATNGVNT